MSINCDCSIDCDDLPGAEFYHESIHKARKPYKCCECGESIMPGSRYQKVVGKWEGDFSVYRTCIPCRNIRENYCPNGFIFTELREAIRECLEFDYLKVTEEPSNA